MTPLYQWAQRHGVPPAAVADLLVVLGADTPADPALTLPPVALTSEGGVQQQARFEAARRGIRLFRNNSGACTDDEGRQIRYGLANDSPQMNEQIKSPDLVGITPVTCRCGWIHGVFTGLECKPPGWHLTPGDKRGQAQLRFGRIVVSLGGIFRFITDPRQIGEIL